MSKQKKKFTKIQKKEEIMFKKIKKNIKTTKMLY